MIVRGLVSLDDVVGDGAAHPCPAAVTRCVVFAAGAGNSRKVRIGGPNVSTGNGIALVPGQVLQFQPMGPPADLATSQMNEVYDMSKIWYYVAPGDTLQVVYVQ
jgi:hypothetical protein